MPKLLTLDFETYYDQHYSLSKMTTEEYVRDDRFETIGFAYAYDDEDFVWVSGADCEPVLRSLDWNDVVLLGQNTAFDAAILAWRYGLHPKGMADTLGMSRALFPHERSHSLKAQAERMGVGVKGEEVLLARGMRHADFSDEQLYRYGEYCKNDGHLTRTLFRLYCEMGFPKGELKLIDMTLRMFTKPILRLDPDKLVDHLHTVQASKAALLAAVSGSDDPEETKSVLMSNPKFAAALQELGVDPPTKISAKTGKEAWAFAKTDEGFQALAEHDDPRVQALVAARLGVKTTLEETRTERLIAMSGRGAFPVPLRYYGAHSGRWSGQDMINLQNLPARGKYAGKIKKAIVAPEGYVVIDCDSAQIEARVLAWMSGQDDLVQTFAAKGDVYKLKASQIYGIPESEVTVGAGSQRQIGKTVVLGAGFGVGHEKLQMFLKTQAGVQVTLDEAKRIIDTYRYSSAEIVKFWDRAGKALKYLMTGETYQVDVVGLCHVVPGKGITLPNGLYIQYPSLKAITNSDGKRELVYRSKGVPVRIYGGKCVENLVQAVARQVVAEQALRISKRYQVVLMVHDAVAIVARKDEADEARAYVEECMSWNPPWATGLPLACESGIGESYGDC